MSITSITIPITSIGALQLQSLNNIHHHLHHFYHIRYSFNPLTLSITIAIAFITSITTSILKQSPSLRTPSRSHVSHSLQLQSCNKVHHHRHHVYHMHYSFDPLTMSITTITIAITSITCITASILEQCSSPSPSRLSHALQFHSYSNLHQLRHIVYHMHYSFNPISKAITIAIPLSYVIQLRSYNNVHNFHHHRHHVYHIHYSFNPITISISIAITSVKCLTASLL